MRGIIIPASVIRPITAVTIRDDDNGMIADIIGMVGGFERVRIGDWRDRTMFGEERLWVTMLVDDNGRLLGKPRNVRASILYGSPIHHESIAGDALLLGEHWGDEAVEFTDLPEQFADPNQWTAWFAAAAADLAGGPS